MVLGTVYIFIHRMVYGRINRVHAEVLTELAAAALILPLVYADLRWGVDTEVSTTDATPIRRGAVRAQVPYVLTWELYTAGAHASEHTRLD